MNTRAEIIQYVTDKIIDNYVGDITEPEMRDLFNMIIDSYLHKDDTIDHNDLNALNVGDYQHLTAVQLADLLTALPFLSGIASNVQNQIANKVNSNTPAITPGTKTKITYDAKGLVLAGEDATTADIADTFDKRYVTDAQIGIIDSVATQIATAVNNLIDSSPGALDTLNELAAALGDDPNFASTITALIGTKQDTLVSGVDIKTINGVPVLGSGDLVINNAVPQASVIYVDSENGVNSTGRGNINEPYLTPEYALSDISNTGTITGDTNTSVTLTNISDVDNALLEVGMQVSGTGISYSTIITAKGNEGSDANTITLSKTTTSSTAAATITFYKLYTLVLNGNFEIVSSLNKEGFNFDFGNSAVVFGDVTVFLFSAERHTPLLINGGDWKGTHINSKFMESTSSNTKIVHSRLNSYYSMGTDYQIDMGDGTVRFSHFYMDCPVFDARFGKVAKLWGDKCTWVGYAYGLLEGLYVDAGNNSSYTFDRVGLTETPASVDAITIARQLRFNINGNIKGQFKMLSGGGVLNGYVKGSSSSIASSIYMEPITINGVIYSSLTCSGDSLIKLNGGVVGAITHTGGKISCSGLMGSYTGSGTSYAILDGASQQGNQEITGITTSGSCEVIFNGAEYTSVLKYTTLNIGVGTTLIATGKSKVQITSCAGDIIFNGLITHNLKSADITGTLTLLGVVYLDRSSAENSTNTPTLSVSTGTIICNAERVECLKADSLSGLFRKTADTGKLIFKGQPQLKVANGLAPLQILSNTGTAQDIINFGCITNCAVGFRLADTFSDATYGTTYAPNILVGGTTYEDTTYDF